MSRAFVDEDASDSNEDGPGRGWIGRASPLARALMGKKVGERALVQLPSGESRLLVTAIDYRE